MSTNDVPGAVPANNDELHIGCWAEAADGSMILVEGVETDRVVFAVFDLTKNPPTDYRTAMPLKVFKDTFTWKGGKGKGGSIDKWTWHDKTPFDWNRVIKAGFPEGERAAFASDQLSAAARVAASLRELGEAVAEKPIGDRYDHRTERVERTGRTRDLIMDKLGRAIGELLR